jgi:acyl-CoA synthetase (AMP-forming)/AMP-acid ligase II
MRLKEVLASCTPERFEREFEDRHTLGAVLSYWATRKPSARAVINHNRGEVLTWADLDRTSSELARQLLRAGFRRGDCLAASLPFLTGHILLEYACFKIGVIHAPLDLRLPPTEVVRAIGLLKARGFAFLGKTAAADFRDLAVTVRRECPFVEHLIQFSPPDETLDRAIPFERLYEAAPSTQSELSAAMELVAEGDPAQAIFTTGSTGSPKAALLSHRSITCQNLCLGAAFGFGERTRLLVNLPPSHVGGQAEALLTTLFWGGTAVVLEAFDAARSLQAVQQHGVNVLGQIPAMYNYQWRLADFSCHDLSSLETAIYGGQQVPASFLEKLSRMAPVFGTGLGLTEAAGFCTYTLASRGESEGVVGIGFDAPVYPLTVREEMNVDGRAGAVLPDGNVGHICFQGPQTFLGYMGDPEATALTISSDGVLYTGDMGLRQEDGLHFHGRAKLIIKPAGHQVFPGDVESHFCALAGKVASCAAVGVPHNLISEAIVAFVEKRAGIELSVQELRRHARGLASFMRPLYYVLLEPGQMPLNRAVKTDYVRLREMALDATSTIRWRAKL